VHSMACPNSSGTAIACPTTATSWAGIVRSGSSSLGVTVLTVEGQDQCQFDGSATVGDYAVLSKLTAGYCHDSGLTTLPLLPNVVVGQILSVAGGTGSLATVLLTPGVTANSGSVPGLTPDGLTPAGIVVSGAVASASVNASTVSASVNKVLLVTAPPYNAKCDGVTDDQTAIQAAFNDAYTYSESVQFPAGTCLTSTISWKAQPFFGAGVSLTIIRGKPGQDVFATPDGVSWTKPVAGTLVHDLRIQVDGTVDASGSPQGNNTFPNRIAGTLGGASNPVTPAISPGPWPFGTAFCTASISAGALNTLNLSGCPPLTNLETWRVIGAPITVNGVGAGGTNLVTTIASVVNATTLTLTTPASSAGTGLSGTFLSPITPPWYIGNCGFAFPFSDGSAPSGGTNEWTFQNVSIIQYNGPSQGNHACGMFMQMGPYAAHFDRVQIQGFWGGYVEAFPALNPGSTTWTGDTSSFKDIDFWFDLIPLVIMGGNHRTFSGINIYGGNQYQTLGGMWLHSGSSATISRFYFECGGTSGEIERFTGLYGINIQGGSLDQCPGGYVLWNASRSNVNAAIASMQIVSGANLNTFSNAGISTSSLTDNGFGNVVDSNGNSNPVNYVRSFYANRPQASVGRLDGSFLQTGNTNTPYLNSSDLLTTCQDWQVAANPSSTYGTCNPDPSGAEINLSYFRSAGPTTVLDGLNFGGVNNIWMGYPRLFGTSVPQTKVTMYVRARCVGAASCFTTASLKDGTSNTIIASATMNFTSSWTTQSLNADLTSATRGDVLDFLFTSWTNTGGTNYDIAWIGFQPLGTLQASVLDLGGGAYNVKAYGAKGDGSTNDCAAITAANTAREAAGGGEMLFPAGQYFVGSACRMTLAQTGTIRGAGNCGVDQTQCTSAIISTDTTGNLFTVTALNFLFSNIALSNSVTPTAGSGIYVNSTNSLQKVDYHHIAVSGFYVDINAAVGALWSMSQSYIGKPILHAMEIQNTVAQDSGDWSITGSFFNLQDNTATAGLYILGAGGGKIVGNKIIGNPTSPVGTDGIYASSSSTGQLMIVGNSIEQLTGSDIHIPQWHEIVIQGNYLEISTTSTTSPINCGNCGDAAVNGNDIIVVNTGSGVSDITMGSGSSGVIGPYAKNTASSTPNSVPATVSDYNMTSAGNMDAPGGTINVNSATTGHSSSTINLNGFFGSFWQAPISASFSVGSMSFQAPRCGVGDGGFAWKDTTGTTVMALNCSTKVLSGISLPLQTQQNKVTLSNSVSNSYTGANFYAQSTNAVGSGHAGITLDKGSSLANAAVNYLDAGSAKWSVGAIGDDNYYIQDDVNNHKVVKVTTGAPASSIVVQADGTVNLASTTFASLPTPIANGAMIYCSDCKNILDNAVIAGSQAVSGGSGSIVVYANSKWRITF